jgi:hypothetical protein
VLTVLWAGFPRSLGSFSGRGHSQKRPDVLWYPPTLLLNGYRRFCPRGQNSHDVPAIDHSAPFCAEVKNEWSCASIPPICLHDVPTDSFYLVLLQAEDGGAGNSRNSV